jgi:hypothetical protein
MKSRISIDVDHDNQPIIKIEYSPSDDVRDKLVKKFLESFGGEISWAKFQYNEYQSPNQLAQIRPINKYDLPEESKTMVLAAKQHEDLQNQLKLEFNEN